MGLWGNALSRYRDLRKSIFIQSDGFQISLAKFVVEAGK